MNNKKKELIEQYKQTHPPMGIYQIRNLTNNKIFVGASLNLPGIFNRSKLQLDAGNHPNKQLQSEWHEFGGPNFAFEILDEITASQGADADYKIDLACLEELWLENLTPYGDRGYNEKKKGKEEKLKEIVERRLSR